MMLTHCGNNVRNRYSGCVFSVKDIVPVPLKTSRNPKKCRNMLVFNNLLLRNGFLDVFSGTLRRGC